MKVVFRIFGYIGTIYLGLSSLYVVSKIIEYFIKQSDSATKGFSHFFNRHWYGFALLLWFFIIFCVLCIPFHLDG